MICQYVEIFHWISENNDIAFPLLGSKCVSELTKIQHVVKVYTYVLTNCIHGFF